MIRNWVEDLLQLTDQDWRYYSFSRDPLIGKITPAMRSEHGQKTVACAQNIAHRMRTEYPTQTPEQIASLLGVKIQNRKIVADFGYTMYAWYEEPDTIVISHENLDLADKLIIEEKLNEFVGNVATADVVIGHELYHFLEQTVPDVYSTLELITLWKIGPFKNRSRIVSLEEIGAMTFTQELMRLNCSPYIFEFIMLCALNIQKAKKLHDYLMDLQTVQRGLPC